jgi:hypothetical protein
MSSTRANAPQVGFVVKLRVDRDQVIDAPILHRMAAVVEHRHIGGAGRAREPDRGILHSGLIEIDPHNGLETFPPQRRADILGVVRGIEQMRGVGIGAVADHQRNARIGERQIRPGADRACGDQKAAEQTDQDIHGGFATIRAERRILAGHLCDRQWHASRLAGFEPAPV